MSQIRRTGAGDKGNQIHQLKQKPSSSCEATAWHSRKLTGLAISCFQIPGQPLLVVWP